MKLDTARLSQAFLRWRRAIVFAVPAAAGALLLAGGQGAPLDQTLRNARDGLRSHSASGQVQIVEIDARSLQALDRWPWPRSYHAAAVDALHRAGARSIAFDVDFSSTSDAAGDASLAAALERAGGSVVLPTLRQQAGAGSSDFIDNVPAKPFQDKAFLAAVNVVPDADGYVRQMLLGLETAGVPRPSLAAIVAEAKAEIGRSFEIDYSIDPDTIPRHSFVDLVEGRIPAERLAGKRFIVGATAVEIWDRYSVPRHGVIPGVVIQAMAAETLLTGAVPATGSGALPLLVALLVLGVALAARRRAVRVALLAGAPLLIMMLPLTTEALFALSMPIVPALAALAAAMLLSGAALAVERFLASALTDDATGLPNLAALEAAAAGPSPTVLVARIDRFAAIASGLGPAATAILVQRVAERLRFAHADRPIYRVDADSLAWLEAAEEDAGLEDRIESIAAVMRSPVECGRLVDVALTFGAAAGRGSGIRQLAANAGLAAVQAAQQGARWRRFLDRDGEAVDWQLSLLGGLDAAMAAGQLWNAYQPKLDLRTREVIGVEALVRWAHPERGPLAPDSFVPVIEQAGRIRDLTIHVLGQALDDALAWDRAGFPIGVAVNVSASLLADHEFIETVGRILQGHALPTSRVTIEVTETAAMDRPERAIAALESWRSHGVNISIDDYGTGQSSLGYLQKLPATELKIDMSFVRTIVEDSRNAIMVRSTVGLAHELGMTTVAEGVEDEACLQRLAEIGCDTAQGYHIGRPMSAADLFAFLAARPRAAA
jgi:EAL domain-containing protein (putative c-di-GMP-specific phosphodiesterase class I)/CHASE2 domain-containing sensor protein